jgi:predicted  nucleic acid-binding Zn-ribbon protein
MNIQAILQYQEVDKSLYAMEREVASCEERKTYAMLKKFWDSAPEKLDAMEVKAAAFATEAKALTGKYEELEATLADFQNLEDMVSDGADVSFYKKKVQAVAEKVKKVKAEISALIASIKSVDEEYQKMKKQVLTVQKQLGPAKKAYDEVKATKLAGKAEIDKKLAEIEPTIDGATLALYKTKRKEKNFPVFVELELEHPVFCGMDLPVVAQNKLKSCGAIECENCRKMIYKK